MAVGVCSAANRYPRIIKACPRHCRRDRYAGKETERKWAEGDDISLLKSKTTEYKSKR